MAELLIPPLRRRLTDAAGLLEAVWASFVEHLSRRAARADSVIDLAASYPRGLTISAIAASGAISISAHERLYPSGARAVEAGMTQAQPYGALRFIYYDDPARLGGLVSYAAAANIEDAVMAPAAPHRHFLGVVTMPASAAAVNTAGKAAKPPGYVAP